MWIHIQSAQIGIKFIRILVIISSSFLLELVAFGLIIEKMSRDGVTCFTPSRDISCVFAFSVIFCTATLMHIGGH